MKSLALVLTLLCASGIYAQQKVTDATHPRNANSAELVRLRTLPSINAEMEARWLSEVKNRQALEVENAEMRSNIADLQVATTEMSRKLADATTLLAVLDKETAGTALSASDKTILAAMKPSDTFNTALAIESRANNFVAAFKKLSDDNAALVKKYNALLLEANNDLSMANDRLAYQQRVNNALTAFSLMHSYAPPAIAPTYQPPVRLQTSCTSNTIGTFVYTTCN